MKVKDQFMDLSTFQVHNGLQIRFWEDKWLGNFTLKEQYPSLFNIARNKHSSVAHVVSTSPFNISFRRALMGDKLIKWNELVVRIDTMIKLFGALLNMDISLFNEPKRLTLDKKLWKLKLPLKIKIFVWFLTKGVFLTKDNLKKRNWNGDDDPNMRPLLCVGASAIVWSIWLCRNDCVFDRKRLYSYLQVIFIGTYWTRFWWWGIDIPWLLMPWIQDMGHRRAQDRQSTGFMG
ncbi:hypothetical protein U9M48_039045 [Paspalum notatum var. saurae]|uniref:Reverse transcriptase zinc-binding domain-containing protein n=1 Tax=Paspalum notatum var. saurae TaxID=547442 RepID=A0AAQ3UMM9_PASNO